MKLTNLMFWRRQPEVVALLPPPVVPGHSAEWIALNDEHIAAERAFDQLCARRATSAELIKAQERIQKATKALNDLYRDEDDEYFRRD